MSDKEDEGRNDMEKNIKKSSLYFKSNDGRDLLVRADQFQTKENTRQLTNDKLKKTLYYVKKQDEYYVALWVPDIGKTINSM